MPGALYFGHLLYADDTAYPRRIEIAVLLPGGALQVEQFDNRPGELNRPAIAIDNEDSLPGRIDGGPRG